MSAVLDDDADDCDGSAVGGGWNGGSADSPGAAAAVRTAALASQFWSRNSPSWSFDSSWLGRCNGDHSRPLLS